MPATYLTFNDQSAFPYSRPASANRLIGMPNLLPPILPTSYHSYSMHLYQPTVPRTARPLRPKRRFLQI
jgi:hypothetical protein